MLTSPASYREPHDAVNPGKNLVSNPERDADASGLWPPTTPEPAFAPPISQTWVESRGGSDFTDPEHRSAPFGNRRIRQEIREKNGRARRFPKRPSTRAHRRGRFCYWYICFTSRQCPMRRLGGAGPLHDLRHAYASLLLERGESLAYMKDKL